MSPRRGIRSRGARVLAWLFFGLAAACADPDQVDRARPDILLITIDTIRADAVGCYGRAEARTPNIDRLAAEGVRFEYAFTPRGATLPALTTILTGVSPLAHGVIGNDHRLLTRQPTLAEVMKEAGYKTAAILTNQCVTLVEGEDHASRGFDVKICAKTDSARDQYLWDRRATDEALRILAEAGDDPLFLWVHYMDPHGPHYPRPDLYRGRLAPDPLLEDQAAKLAGWEERDETPPPDMMEILWALYDAEIAGVDEQVGRLVEAFLARRPASDSVIALAGDHGEELYEHNNFRGHGDSIYDSVLRIPLILRAPGRVPEGLVSTWFAELEDLYPTLQELSGVEPSKRLQGESLLPRLQGADGGREGGIGVAYGLWSADILTIRRPRYRYVWNKNPGGQKQPVFKHRERFEFFRVPDLLFDHERDPRERQNLLRGEVTEVAEQLRKGLRRQLHAWTRHERHIQFDPEAIVDPRVEEELRQLGYR